MFSAAMDGGSPSRPRRRGPRRIKTMPLSPGHLASPKRHVPALVLVVPVLLVVVTIMAHRLPLLLLLLPLLGMYLLLMQKKKLLSMLSPPLLLHLFTPRLMSRVLSVSLFLSWEFCQSCRSLPWLLILLVVGLLYQLTTITRFRTSDP